MYRTRAIKIVFSIALINYSFGVFLPYSGEVVATGIARAETVINNHIVVESNAGNAGQSGADGADGFGGSAGQDGAAAATSASAQASVRVISVVGGQEATTTIESAVSPSGAAVVEQHEMIIRSDGTVDLQDTVGASAIDQSGAAHESSPAGSAPDQRATGEAGAADEAATDASARPVIDTLIFVWSSITDFFAGLFEIF